MVGVSESLSGYNMFAYCFNNPVNMADNSGNWPQWIKDAANWLNNSIIQPVASFVKDITEDINNFDWKEVLNTISSTLSPVYPKANP